MEPKKADERKNELPRTGSPWSCVCCATKRLRETVFSLGREPVLVPHAKHVEENR